MSYPELLILRHGETEWNRAGRMQGEADSPLTELGRAQAAAQGRLLDRFDITGWSICSSPQGRSVQTARIALEGRIANIALDPRLTEITLGAWSGVPRAQIMQDAPHLFELDDSLIWYDHAPGGEGLAALYDRAGAFLAQCTAPTVVFTHGITSRMLRCHALGFDVGAFANLPGGQGVIYHLAGGQQRCLAE
jgi:probable phosphoglycerate mutase